MASYTQVFGAGTILPGDVSYNTLTTGTDATLVWPREANAGGNVAGAVMDITTTASNVNITMASATGISTGYAVTFYNSGSNAYFVKDAGGTVRATVAVGAAWIFINKDNSTAAGAWLIFQMGAGSASVNAASLAGTGLIASGSLLTLDAPTDSLNSTYTIGTSDRARFKNWTGGSGTINLLQAGTATNGFWFSIRNSGSGSLSIARAGSDVINGSATSFTVSVGEAAWFVCDGTGWYTFGYGRSLTGTGFALLSIDISGTGDYTLSAGQLNQVGYKLTGTLTGARNLIVPTTVAQYWIDNSTSGAFTFTVKTAAGTGVVVPSGSRYILYTDGTNVIDADTGSFASPLAVVDGGTGATTASSARTNLGATSVGNSVFTAASSAAARTALGSGAIGDTLFTSATAASARSTLGSGATGDSLFTAATAAAAQSTLSVPPTSRTISTSGYTSGGGDLSANRTITLGSMGAASRVMGSGSAAATITDLTLGTGLGISSTTLSNTGVTSIVAGTNISISGATGAVTVNAAAAGPTGLGSASLNAISIDFTGIPSTAKRITIVLNGAKFTTSSVPCIQVGNGSIVTTGYVGQAGIIAGTNATGTVSSTVGFPWSTTTAIAQSGVITLMLDASNSWIMSAVVGGGGFTGIAGGTITLGGSLDRVRITSVAGTNAFTAGSANVYYE